MHAAQTQQPFDLQPPVNNGQHFTSRHGAAGLRWLFSNRERWGLTMDDLAVLLGGFGRRTLTHWQRKVHQQEAIELSRDVMERISLLLGIHKALTLITPDGHEELAWEWFQKPVDLMGLQGQSIRDYLIRQGSMEALYYIRRNLDAMRG
ncbi:MAG TPA: hypothetical protein DHU56_04195 [Marinobacter sp.]|jgi:hypothetical protein|uniref:antitoxin Xre-like helix-turn-helix domain-containing protein n=1 Tax=Marinobacter sp. TaxID=50741 RepID=UPI000ECCEC57|nr:antitoxin Xre-like helix-turn-helix domain-containing protein [Marinobacter sp.]MBC7190862.1 hypothetical protein [Marinobacter sp.]HCW89244.1 hypothetical protein [Marinobacter sp.]